MLRYDAEEFSTGAVRARKAKRQHRNSVIVSHGDVARRTFVVAGAYAVWQSLHCQVTWDVTSVSRSRWLLANKTRDRNGGKSSGCE